jgi:ABC-type transporter Mla maintaining outer membrane lipid asymmetry ATPase subunit MlaF
MSPARVDLKNLRKSFGPTDVLADISLSVQQGEFVSILGPLSTAEQNPANGRRNSRPLLAQA